jgi:D-aspartate ligase
MGGRNMLRNISGLLNSDRNTAVVYPASAVNAYGTIRSLGEKGIPVIGLDWNPSSPSFKSRYCAGITCPHAIFNTDEFVDFLVNLGRQTHRKPVLYMMIDVYVYIACKYRRDLEDYYYFPFLSDETLNICVNKEKMLGIVARCDIPAPKTFFPKTLEDLRKRKSEIIYPSIVKPLTSAFDYDSGKISKFEEFPKTFGTKALRAENFEDLEDAYKKTLEMKIDVCIQEEIPGDADRLYCLHLYADRRSEMKGIFTGRKLRQQPADFGTGTFTEGIAAPREIVEYGRRFVESIGFFGIGNIEFKLDPRDGVFKFLEINPRGYYWFHLGTACGVNFPYIAYLDLTGKEAGLHRQGNCRKKWIDLQTDFMEYYLVYRKDRNSPFYISFWKWLFSLKGVKVEAVLNLRDPVPGILRMLDFLGGLIRMVPHKILKVTKSLMVSKSARVVDTSMPLAKPNGVHRRQT